MTFDTKITVVLREDLETWQKLNVTAFTVSAIAATVDGVTGESYVDGSGNTYMPMFKQPVMVYAADAGKMRTIYERARSRQIEFSIFTEDLFATNNDIDNRLAVAARTESELQLVGMAFRADKKISDKILKGVSLHK